MRSIEKGQVCRACGITKPSGEFGFRSRSTGVRSTRCRLCTAAYQHAWYVAGREALIQSARLRRDAAAGENRTRAWEYLSEHPCVDCGESDPVVLEFDHIRDKRANVSQLISSGLSWATIEAEIEKCEVRCVNCHMRKTARHIGIFERKQGFRRLQDDFIRYVPGT